MFLAESRDLASSHQRLLPPLDPRSSIQPQRLFQVSARLLEEICIEYTFNLCQENTLLVFAGVRCRGHTASTLVGVPSF